MPFFRPLDCALAALDVLGLLLRDVEVVHLVALVASPDPRSPSSRRAPSDFPFPWVTHRVLRAPRRKSTAVRQDGRAAREPRARAAPAGTRPRALPARRRPRAPQRRSTSASGRRPSSAASTGAAATGTRPGKGIPSLDRHPGTLERSAGQSPLDEQRPGRERESHREQLRSSSSELQEVLAGEDPLDVRARVTPRGDRQARRGAPSSSPLRLRSTIAPVEIASIPRAR